MAWTRSDDTTLLHPKVLRAGRGGDDRMVNEVYGFVARCCTWSGGLLQDGFIPEEIATVASPTRWRILVKAAISAGMLTKRHRNAEGDVGWTVVMEDNLFHVRSKEEVLKDREASRRLTRVQQVARDVRLRDGDQCRYCAKTVTFKGDRKSNRAGQYDHVIPTEQDGDESLDNIVVACGACNRLKGPRTPEQAGMTLRPAPDQPWYSPHTREQFQLDAAPAPARTTGTEDAAATAARTEPPADAATPRPDAAQAPDPAPADRSPQARPASDLDLSGDGGSPGSGPGRDGGGSGPPSSQPRDGPRRRGSRGRRGRGPSISPPPDST